MISKLHHWFCVALGELMGGHEDFPETKSDKALGWFMAFCFAVAVLLVFA